MWVVDFDEALHGSFDSADACYNFAAKVSREPNDWQPIEVRGPALAIQWAREEAATAVNRD